MSEPKMQQHIEGGSAVKTWWMKADGQPVKSDNLAPVRLPVGLEAAITTTIKRLK